MFTGELSFETIMVDVTRWDRGNNEDIASNVFLGIFYVWFVFEMCVILMNLTIGLSISNIQVNLNNWFFFCQKLLLLNPITIFSRIFGKMLMVCVW